MLCLFYKNVLSQEKNKFGFRMSHRLENTSVFNSSNEIKKFGNRGATGIPQTSKMENVVIIVNG